MPSRRNGNQWLGEMNTMTTKKVLEVWGRDSLRATLTFDGCGGTYLLSRGNHSVGVFKPRDEEFMAPQNPRGYTKRNAILGDTLHPVQPGFRIGNGAFRERAAYVLDVLYHHYSNVPPTCITTLQLHPDANPSCGSLQQFIAAQGTAEDWGYSTFKVDQVHKIALLDIRLFNADRHAGNILITSKEEMIPIDHGFCLPAIDRLQSARFEWLRWPQSRAPLGPRAKDYIANMNIERDVFVLRHLGIEEDSITTFRMTSEILRFGINAGHSLHSIGQIFVRKGDESNPSQFETLIQQHGVKFPPSIIDFSS